MSNRNGFTGTVFLSSKRSAACAFVGVKLETTFEPDLYVWLFNSIAAHTDDSFLGRHDVQIGYSSPVSVPYGERTYRAPIAAMVFKTASNVLRVAVLYVSQEGGVLQPTKARNQYITFTEGGYVVSDAETVSLGGVANALYGDEKCHLGQVLGPPNTCYANRTPLDNAMFHDDAHFYSLYATGPTKAYGLVDWDAQSISTPSMPPASLAEGVRPELTHVGNGRYIMVLRNYSGVRKTVGVFLGSPWVGWEEVLPLAIKGTPISPINVFAEYLHVDGVYYDYTTGECQLEGVLKDLGTGHHRFAKYSRRDFTDARWRLVGKVQNFPDSGNVTYALSSYGKGAGAQRRMMLPNMHNAFIENYAPSLNELVPSYPIFTYGISGYNGVAYTIGLIS